MKTTKEKREIWLKDAHYKLNVPVLDLIDDINTLESENERLRAQVEELKARKCSHGDYRMQGTTDCSNRYGDCDGSTEYYVIGKGLCVECRHKEGQS